MRSWLLCINPLLRRCLSLVVACALFCCTTVTAQTNSFPLYSAGAWSGGSGDYSNITNSQLKLQATSGYNRLAHVSVDPVVSTVYSYETNKNVYWGESTDAGKYYFRGRNLVVLDGNLGVGTDDTKSYSLAVNGSAIFTSAWVKPYSNWPDYVFQPEYVLPPLDSVSAYIRQNHHLPDVPSADSIQANGLNLGDNQATLLKKIEELTLYMIRQEAQLKAQNEKIDRLEQLLQENRKKTTNTVINTKP